MEKLISEISTHKAIVKDNVINIIKKGLYIDDSLSWDDEILYTIPIERKDDVFAIMERFSEQNRINLSECKYF